MSEQSILSLDQNNTSSESNNLVIIDENMHVKMHNFTESSSKCSTAMKNGINTATNRINADDTVDKKINKQQQQSTATTAEVKKKNSSEEINVELEKAINTSKTPKKTMMQLPVSATGDEEAEEDAIASASSSSAPSPSSSSIKIKSSSADDALLTTGNAGVDDDATTVEENGQKIQCENVDLLNSVAAFNENDTDRIHSEADLVKDEDIEQKRSPSSSIASIKNKMLKKGNRTTLVKNNTNNHDHNNHQHHQEKSVIEKSNASDKNSNRKMNDVNVGDDCDDCKVFTDNVDGAGGCSGVDGGNDDVGSVENLSAQTIVAIDNNNYNPKKQLKRIVSDTMMNTSSPTSTVSTGTVDTALSINNFSKTPAAALKQDSYSSPQFKQTFAQILSNSNKNNTTANNNNNHLNNNNKSNTNSNIINNDNNNCDFNYKSDSKVMLNSNKNNCSNNYQNENLTLGDNKLVDKIKIYSDYSEFPIIDEQFDEYSQVI